MEKTTINQADEVTDALDDLDQKYGHDAVLCGIATFLRSADGIEAEEIADLVSDLTL